MKFREIFYIMAVVSVGFMLLAFHISSFSCPEGKIGLPVFGKGIYCFTAERLDVDK